MENPNEGIDWKNSVQIQIKTRVRGEKYIHKWSQSFREVDWQILRAIIHSEGLRLEMAEIKKRLTPNQTPSQTIEQPKGV